MRFSIQLIHDLNTNTTHSPAQVLDNVKTIQNDFSAWKKLSSQVMVGTEHVHCNDLDATSHLSGITKEMIANSHLCPSVEDWDDLERVKILRNEAHLYLPIETVTSLTVLTSQLMYSGSQARSALRSNSFSFRITVEVETAKLSAMSVIESFSITFWAIFCLTMVAIWWFFLTRELSATATFPQFWQRKRRFFLSESGFYIPHTLGKVFSILSGSRI